MLRNKLFTLILLDKIDNAKVSHFRYVYMFFLQMIVKYRYAALIIYAFPPHLTSGHCSFHPLCFSSDVPTILCPFSRYYLTYFLDY